MRSPSRRSRSGLLERMLRICPTSRELASIGPSSRLSTARRAVTQRRPRARALHPAAERPAGTVAGRDLPPEMGFGRTECSRSSPCSRARGALGRGRISRQTGRSTACAGQAAISAPRSVCSRGREELSAPGHGPQSGAGQASLGPLPDPRIAETGRVPFQARP